MVTAEESIVFGHYMMKYNLLKLGFSWREIDDLSAKEVKMVMALYTALETKERGLG